VVVACNSAAAAALSDLQTRLPVPVIGVIEPGVKAALAATKTGRVGVIGTEGTIASHAYTKTAAALSPKVEIFAQSCPGFVEFVEAGDVDSPELYQLAQEHLAPIKAANVDVLVLGCTHYPLLASTLSSVMGPQVAVISSAHATARAISAIELRSGSNSAPTHHFITSGDPNTFHALATRFLGSEINDVEEHSWS
jgi:glutamate racemase